MGFFATTIVAGIAGTIGYFCGNVAGKEQGFRDGAAAACAVNNVFTREQIEKVNANLHLCLSKADIDYLCTDEGQAYLRRNYLNFIEGHTTIH